MYLGATKREIPNEEPYGTMKALNALTGEKKWEFRMKSPPWCGVLATGGDVVFSGTMEGDFFALDAWTGKVLWRFQTGGEIWANPISYRSEGKQYIAVAAGSSMMVFGLP
jgi:alcohol dehydrogenase (cytochrome c)